MFFNRKDTRASSSISGDCIRSGVLRVGSRAEGVLPSGLSIPELQNSSHKILEKVYNVEFVEAQDQKPWILELL